MSRNGSQSGTPALTWTPSSRPKRSATAVTTRSTSPASVTSHRSKTAPSGSSSAPDRSAATAIHPADSAASTVPRPMPLAPPVTRTTGWSVAAATITPPTSVAAPVIQAYYRAVTPTPQLQLWPWLRAGRQFLPGILAVALLAVLVIVVPLRSGSGGDALDTTAGGSTAFGT